MIVESLLDEKSTYDPRLCVNLEASRLLWGSQKNQIQADPKAYRRKLRQSAEDSTA